MVIFERVAIIGVGLIGGSLGLALCERKLAGEVIGIGRNQENLNKALEIKAVNKTTTFFQEGLIDVELVIMATPVETIIPILKEIQPFLRAGTIVTDVGSTKVGVVEKAEALLNQDEIFFIGGHPMAGSEKSGIESASSSLFKNALYLLTPTSQTNNLSLQKVKLMAESIGARVIEFSPDRHDFMVAAISHLPRMIATALVNTVAELPEGKQIFPLAAGGFCDTTRIAASNPLMWRDIFLTNREKILEMAKYFRQQLDIMEMMIAESDGEVILSYLEHVSHIRRSL